MSELLPSELARLILGYFESKGFTRTVETMLNEIPELVEVMQRRKKGQKVKLKVRDFLLTDLLDDYFTAKDIIYESITDYPATFSSVKKIQALADQVRNIVEIAIRSKTFKFYPKNLYRSKQYIQSKIAEENASKLPNEIAITVGEFQDVETTSHKRLDVDTTPASSLPGSSERVSNSDGVERNDNDNAYQSKSVDTMSEETPADSLTPQKRKGSLRKKGRPSPNSHPKTPKQIEADERMEKLLKNLIENKELHTKIADSINSTLFLPSNTERNIEIEVPSINQTNSCSSSSNNNRSNAVMNKNNFNVNINHPQQQQVKNSCEYSGSTQAELKNSNLSDIIISNLSLQVTNDPVMDSILASIDCDTQSSHRQLSTPVPEFPLSQTNLSFSNSVFRLQSCDSQMQPCISANSQPPSNSEHTSFGTSSPEQTTKTNTEIACVDSFTLKSNPCISTTGSSSNTIIGEQLKSQETSQTLTLGECFSNPNVNVDLDRAQNITLRKCFHQTSESVRESSEECSESQELPAIHSANHQEDQHTTEHPVEPHGLDKSNQNKCGEIDPDKNNSKASNVNQLSLREGNANPVESNSVIFNGEIAKIVSLTDSKASHQPQENEYHFKKPDFVMNLNNAPRDREFELPSNNTNLSSEVPQNYELSSNVTSDRPPSDRAIPNLLFNEKDDVSIISRNFELPSNSTKSSDMPQNYEMSPNSSDRPTPIRAIPVSLSNNSMVNSKYLSGTPDHPNSYTITELTPLPPGTPSEEWNSNNVGNLSETSNIDTIESTSNNIVLLSSETVNESSNVQLFTNTNIEVRDVAKKLKNTSSAVINDNQFVQNSDSQMKNCENNSPKNIETDQQTLHESTGNVKRKRGRKRKTLCRKGANRKQRKSVFKSSHTLKKNLSKKSNKSSYSNNRGHENDLDMDNIIEDMSGSSDTRWVGTAKELSEISNLSRMENLVTELESGLVKEKVNQNEDSENENFENDLNISSNSMQSKSSTDLSPQLQSLVSFSKTFVLNTSYSRKEETPSCNERITVYKGSLSSPRNRNSHIRVLDFNTPRKLSNSKKNSSKARTNLQFSPSPKSKFLLNLNNKRLVRTRSLTLSVQKSTPLESILESSREGVDSFITENDLSEKNVSKEENLCNLSSSPVEVVVDQSLSESVHDGVLTASKSCTAKEFSSPKKIKAISLQTPGKENPLICLEPSTPFIELTTVSTTLLNVPGTELNTPNPESVPITVATPCISSSIEENISQDSYYEPAEKSITNSIEEDNIENTLIKTAQLQEIEMEKLRPQEPQISPSKSQDSNESVEESNKKESEDDSLFSGLLKNRPKYKLRKMTNKELGEVVEQEMNLLEQMRNLLESNSNSEETVSREKTEELDKSAKELKKNRLFIEKGKCSSKLRSSALSRKKLHKTQKMKFITYKDFLNDFELLKKCFIECLQNSYIESARTLLPYHLELFEKQKSYQSNFQEDKIVEHLIKMINYYSSPSMVRTMQQKIKKYKSLQKNNNCEEKETAYEKSNGKSLPKKRDRKVEKNSESNETDVSINILECEIDVVVEGKPKKKSHLETKSLEDFQGRDNCVVDGTEIIPFDKNKIKEKKKHCTDSSSISKKLKTPLKSKQSNESNDKDLSLEPVNEKICHPKDAENNQVVEHNVDKTQEMSEPLSNVNEDDDEYCLIERQLAALDGSVINSPTRDELTSNTMNDDNISVMFTPSNQVSENYNCLSPASKISKEIMPSLSPVKMMSYTPLPGTPVKQVEEICQSVVKNKVALVAIPSQSFRNNNSQNIMADLEITEDGTLLSTSHSQEVVSVEKDMYLSDESLHENSFCSLSFSECFNLFSLNLSPKTSKLQLCDKTNIQSKKTFKNTQETRNKATSRRKGSKNKDDKSKSLNLSKGRRPSQSSLKKCKKVNKKSESISLDSSFTSKSKPFSESQSSSVRKLNFVTSKRKRNEIEETCPAKKRKLENFINTTQTCDEGTMKKLNSSLNSMSATEDVDVGVQASEEAPKGIYKTAESENCGTNKDFLDETESLVELHLSSSDSENEQDQKAMSKKSPSPEKISNSLLKGGSFELSTTPNKLQTVISKFPNQDNYPQYNDESYFSIPPTPGKHLFLPENPGTSNEKNDDPDTNITSLNTYGLRESSYDGNVKPCNTLPISPEKRKSPRKVTDPRKKKNSPRIQSKRTNKSNICSESSSNPSSNTAAKDIFSKLKSLFGDSFSNDENNPSLKGQKKTGERASSKRKKGVNEKNIDSTSGNEAKKLQKEESTTLSVDEKKNLQLLLNVISAKNK